ncbi:hypothetical protein WJX79_002350 [Trebouxia sp. C0005]
MKNELCFDDVCVTKQGSSKYVLATSADNQVVYLAMANEPSIAEYAKSAAGSEAGASVSAAYDAFLLDQQQNNILRQLANSAVGSGKALVICGFRAAGARAQMAAHQVQLELKGNYVRMLDTRNKLSNNCWTSVYGISFGGPKFIGKDEAGTVLPECQKCFWSFVFEGDVMPSLMTSLPKDEDSEAWQEMLTAVSKNLQQRNVDDEQLSEELQKGAFITEKALKHIGIIFKVDAWGGLTDLTRDPKALFTISKAMKTSPNPVSWHKSVSEGLRGGGQPAANHESGWSDYGGPHLIDWLWIVLDASKGVIRLKADATIPGQSAISLQAMTVVSGDNSSSEGAQSRSPLMVLSSYKLRSRLDQAVSAIPANIQISFDTCFEEETVVNCRRVESEAESTGKRDFASKYDPLVVMKRALRWAFDLLTKEDATLKQEGDALMEAVHGIEWFCRVASSGIEYYPADPNSMTRANVSLGVNTTADSKSVLDRNFAYIGQVLAAKPDIIVDCSKMEIFTFSALCAISAPFLLVGAVIGAPVAVSYFLNDKTDYVAERKKHVEAILADRSRTAAEYQQTLVDLFMLVSQPANRVEAKTVSESLLNVDILKLEQLLSARLIFYGILQEGFGTEVVKPESMKQILGKLEDFERRYKKRKEPQWKDLEQGGRIATDGVRGILLHTTAVVLSAQLRCMLEGKCFVALAGMQSCGKSTLTQQLVGLKANCNAGIGYDLHTTTPLFYHLKNEDKDKLLLMDLPAMNATNKAIAMTTMAVGGDMFCAVFVTTFNGNLDSSQMDQLTVLLMQGCPVLICMNKAGKFEEALPTKQKVDSYMHVWRGQIEEMIQEKKLQQMVKKFDIWCTEVVLPANKAKGIRDASDIKKWILEVAKTGGYEVEAPTSPMKIGR